MSERLPDGQERKPAINFGRILWLFFIVLLLLLFVDFLILPLQFVYLLLFGWIAYLGRVVPHITLNPEIAIEAVVALALALYGLHRILCWWAGQRGGEAAQWRFTWTVKITAMVLLLFATSISAVGVVHQIAWLCRDGNIIEMVGYGKMTREMSDLKQLVTAVRIYSMDNKDRFPKQLDELVPDYLDDYQLLFTRAMNGDPPQRFLYFPGYGTHDDSSIMIAASPRPFESTAGGRRCVAYIDGSARIVFEKEFQEHLQKQRLLPRKE